MPQVSTFLRKELAIVLDKVPEARCKSLERAINLRPQFTYVTLIRGRGHGNV